MLPCNDICKQLDVLVFSDEDEKLGPVSQQFLLSGSYER